MWLVTFKKVSFPLFVLQLFVVTCCRWVVVCVPVVVGVVVDDDVVVSCIFKKYPLAC